MRKRTALPLMLTLVLWLGLTTTIALAQQITFLPLVANRSEFRATPTPVFTYTPPLTYTPPPIPTPTYTPPAAVDPSLVPVVGHTTYTSLLGRHIAGEVENRATFPVTAVFVRIQLYDAADNLIGEMIVPPFGYGMDPEQKACFNVITPSDFGNWTRYEMATESALGPASPRPRLTILNVRPALSPFGTFALNGTVRNDDSRTVEGVVVFGSLYDRNGNFIDCARPLDMAVIESLAPGDAVDFTITFGQPPTAVGSYQVAADGLPINILP